MKRNNSNITLLSVNQKGSKEPLSNYNLTVLDDNEDSILVKNDTYKHISIYDDIIDRLSDFLDDTKMFKSTVEKIILLNRQYIAKDKDELILLIDKSIKLFGNKCDLNWIDTSLITDMSCLFYDMAKFNGHIEKWDVHNVKDMSFMFFNAKTFNQSLNNWDVSNVIDMRNMFSFAESFNQPIGKWNVNNVKYMQYMFHGALVFNQPIDNWNVSNVTTMQGMFLSTESFNQPLGNWDVGNVKNMEYMFNNAKSFNQPINNWDVSNVKDKFNIFKNCPIREEYKPIFNK